MDNCKESLLAQLPEYFRGILDFRALMDTEQITLDEAADAILQVQKNFFVQTCDTPTLEQWEKILNLTAVAGDTVEFRRWRILTRLNLRLPYTLPQLRIYLDNLLGTANYRLALDYAGHSLVVEVAEGIINPRVLEELTRQLGGMLPAHIAYQIISYQNGKQATAYAFAVRGGESITDGLPVFVS